MALPTFLGIGAPKCGTTWLYTLLATHPQIYVPPHRKEVSFFIHHFEQGTAWYERFFPTGDKAAEFRALGEITSGYIYYPECPERMASVPSIDKLILILRNPVDRAYSIYKHWLQNWNYTGSVDDFWRSNPDAIQNGFYSQYLQNYLRYFSRDQILILIFEDIINDVPVAKQQLANFFDISVNQFPAEAGTTKINPSYIPRARHLYALTAALTRRLRSQAGLGWIADTYLFIAKRLGFRHLLGNVGVAPPIDDRTREFLVGTYTDEVKKLEIMIERDLTAWKNDFD